MKPLPRENIMFEFLRVRIFRFFDTFVTVSSRIHILSILYRILTVLGFHFGTLGPTFGGLFFRSQKTQKVFFVSAPGWRPSWTPPEKGGTGRHLGGIWETSGRHLGGIWEASRRQGARGGPEEAGIEKVDRRLQPNAKVPFIFQFYEAFLRVGITNYQFLQRIMMPGSRGRIPAPVKGPLATPPGPLRGKLCLGNERCDILDCLFAVCYYIPLHSYLNTYSCAPLSP